MSTTTVEKIVSLDRSKHEAIVQRVLKQYELKFKDICEGKYDRLITDHLHEKGVSAEFPVNFNNHPDIDIDLEQPLEPNVYVPSDDRLCLRKRIHSEKTIANQYLVVFTTWLNGKPSIYIDLDRNSIRNSEYFTCKTFLDYITCGCLRRACRRLF